ncbi:MAG TPA: hypothetical protein VH518_09765 [Tepidisphaeraceae bacterium]
MSCSDVLTALPGVRAPAAAGLRLGPRGRDGGARKVVPRPVSVPPATPPPAALAPVPVTAINGVWRAVAVLAVVVALVRTVVTIPVFTNTIDEPFHLAGAVGIYEMQKHVMGVENPPLPYLVAGLGLSLGGVQIPRQHHNMLVQNEHATCESGTDILFKSPLSYWQILWRARGSMLIFGVVALLYLYLLGRWLDSEALGAAAVGFFSLDPTLLGHWMWVGTDVAATAGFLAGLYHGAIWIEKPTTRGRAIAAGMALGLAVGCKFSCLLLVPILLVVAVIRYRRGPEPRRPTFSHIALVVFVAFMSLWALYLFDFGPISQQVRFTSDSEWRLIPDWLKNTSVPMPSLWLGLLWLAGHSRSGHPAFINGHLGRSGWWYYFPEAIGLKSPFGMLLALLIAVACCFGILAARRRLATTRSIPITIAAGGFLLVAMFSRIDIGIRHVLPALALLYLLICWQLIRHGLAVALCACILLAGIETARAHPNYLSYFNSIAGGPQQGAEYLADSNIDWGQDVGRLAQWLRTSPEAAGRPYSLRLFMFPRAELIQNLGLDPKSLEGEPHGLFAISKDISCRVFGFDIKKDGTRVEAPDYSWITSRHPLVKRIGDSIDVYDLDRRLPNAEPDSPSQVTAVTQLR